MSARFSTICPYCGTARTRKNGVRNRRQRYWCRDCERNFDHPDFHHPRGRRFQSLEIGNAVREYYLGKSASQVAASMKKTRFGSQVSRETVNRWVVEYTGAALNFVKSVPVPTARQWLAMDVGTSVINGGECRAWFVVDSRSSYILACHLSGKWNAEGAAQVLKMAGQVAGDAPESVTFEADSPYEEAAGQIFPEADLQAYNDGNAPVSVVVPKGLAEALIAQAKRVRRMKDRERALLHLKGWAVCYNFMGGHESIVERAPWRDLAPASYVPSWHYVVRSVRPVHHRLS